MAKKAYVYSGTDWVPLASEVTDLTAYATKAENGLVHINTTSFSAVASQSFDNVFSSTYDNYKIVFNITSATAVSGLNFRLRVGGVDNSSSNYNWIIQGWAANSANPAFFAQGSNGASNIGKIPIRIGNSTHNSSGSVEIFNPFNTAYTSWQGLGTQPNVTTSLMFLQWSHCSTTVTTSYDGFTIYPDTGNMTGLVSVYGLKD
jgi:hypothetical protein